MYSAGQGKAPRTINDIDAIKIRFIIIIIIIVIIIIMAVKTSGCPDILYNYWAASRNQSMQRPKSLQLKS